MNSNISSTSCVDSHNLRNVDMKNNGNRLDSTKGTEAQHIAEPDCRNSTESPPIETLVESIYRPEPSSKPYNCNEYFGKRIKLEHGMNNVYYKKQETEDDCEAFGRYIAVQLRQMHCLQKLLAQRLISDVCFRGQIQTLQMNTILTQHMSPISIIPPTTLGQHQAIPVLTRFPFNRGTDYNVMHQLQQPVNIQAHMQTNGNTIAFQHKGIIDNQQQPDRTSAPLYAMSNMASNERIQ